MILELIHSVKVKNTKNPNQKLFNFCLTPTNNTIYKKTYCGYNQFYNKYYKF